MPSRHAIALCSTTLAVAACATPFEPDEAGSEHLLANRVAAAIERELATLETADLREPTSPPSVVEEALAGRRAELDAMGPKVPFLPAELDMGPDLTGAEQGEVAISLRSAITSAVENNLSIQIARLQPAINEADVIAAEAVFDALFITDVSLSRIDEPQTVPVVGGTQIGVPFSTSEQYRFETGLRKRLTSGADVSLTTELSRFKNLATGIDFFPDPAYSSAVRLGISQPILRGFGTRVNTATIRLTRNLERRSIEQLRAELMELVDRTESDYWELVFAWQDLEIQEWLLEVGIAVRDIMERRREFDTRLAQYSDAVARVEQRKGNIIRSRRSVRAASDALKVRLNDPRLTVGSEVLLLPVDTMVETPIRYDLREAILNSVGGRPEVQQAILRIDDASIRQELADNGRLPLFNLSAQLSYFGLDDSAGGSYDNLFDGSFLTWVVGANFEWPLGNRAAEAEYRKTRLQRSAAVVAYELAVQAVIFDVKSALRDCITNYELIQANRSFRIAQTENLRALRVEEETLAGLTPEFLALKFDRQEVLAIAQGAETRALVNYNKSVAGLHRAMGLGLAMNRIELDVERATASGSGDNAEDPGGE